MASTDHDARYQRYIDNKLARLGYANATFKTQEQWEKAVDFWRRSKGKGDRFRDGMTVLRDQTPQFGYELEVRVRTPEGDRVQDARHIATGHSSEYKAGAVDREKSLPQLAKDERELQAGHTVDWTIVQGARIDKDIQARMAQLQREYPDQFRVYVVSKEVARLALTIGKRKEKERCREALAQRREAKELAARERERLAPKRLAERRQELVKDAKVMQQAVRAAEEHGITMDPQKLAAAEKALRKEEREVERAGRKQAKELVSGLGLSERQAREMEAYLAERRAEYTAPVRQAIQEIGAKTREIDAAEKKEAQEKQAALERDRLFKAEQERARAAREAAGLDPRVLRGLEAADGAAHTIPSQEMSREERENIRRLNPPERDARGLYRGRER